MVIKEIALKDLRSFLTLLKSHGELLSVQAEVDPRFEVGEILRQFDEREGPALLFEKVRGHSARIAGNLVGSRRRLALAFELPQEKDLLQLYQERRAKKIEPQAVRSGPVKEVVLKEPGKVDLGVLPIPTYHEGDGGPYVTCGVVTSKSPDTGLRSMGLHRLHIKGPNRMGIHLTNPPIAQFAREAEARGEALDIAVSLGVHPIPLDGLHRHVAFGRQGRGSEQSLGESP